MANPVNKTTLLIQQFDFVEILNSKEKISTLISPIFIEVENRYKDQILDSRNLTRFFALGFRDLKRIEPNNEQEIDNLLARINYILSNETEKLNTTSFKEAITEKLCVELGIEGSKKRPILIDMDGVAHLPETDQVNIVVIDSRSVTTSSSQQQNAVTSSPVSREKTSSSKEQNKAVDQKQHDKTLDKRRKTREKNDIQDKTQQQKADFLKKCYRKKHKE